MSKEHEFRWREASASTYLERLVKFAYSWSMFFDASFIEQRWELDDASLFRARVSNVLLDVDIVREANEQSIVDAKWASRYEQRDIDLTHDDDVCNEHKHQRHEHIQYVCSRKSYMINSQLLEIKSTLSYRRRINSTFITRKHDKKCFVIWNFINRRIVNDIDHTYAKKLLCDENWEKKEKDKQFCYEDILSTSSSRLRNNLES